MLAGCLPGGVHTESMRTPQMAEYGCVMMKTGMAWRSKEVPVLDEHDVPSRSWKTSFRQAAQQNKDEPTHMSIHDPDVGRSIIRASN